MLPHCLMMVSKFLSMLFIKVFLPSSLMLHPSNPVAFPPYSPFLSMNFCRSGSLLSLPEVFSFDCPSDPFPPSLPLLLEPNHYGLPQETFLSLASQLGVANGRHGQGFRGWEESMVRVLLAWLLPYQDPIPLRFPCWFSLTLMISLSLHSCKRVRSLSPLYFPCLSVRSLSCRDLD